MQRASDIQRTENYLRKAALSVEVGEKLPSVRLIRKKCGVSQSTIDRAIENLRNESLLEVRARSGLYRNVGQLPNVKLFYFSDLTGLSSHFNMLFHGFFVSRLFFTLCNIGRRLNMIERPGKNLTDEDFKQLCSERPCTILTVGVRDSALDRFNKLEEIGYTVVHLLPNLPTPPEAAVQVDDSKIMESILGYLAGRNIKRVAYFHRMKPETWRRAEHLRFAAFHHHALQLGLEIRKEYIVSICPVWEPYLQCVADEAEKLMKLPEPPEALILTGDHYAKSVYRGIRNAGGEPGRDIAVLGIDNLPCCDFFDPSLSSAGFDVEHSFKLLADMINDMENGGKRQVIMLPVKIFERESTSLFKAKNKITKKEPELYKEVNF